MHLIELMLMSSKRGQLRADYLEADNNSSLGMNCSLTQGDVGGTKEGLKVKDFSKKELAVSVTSSVGCIQPEQKSQNRMHDAELTLLWLMENGREILSG